MSPFAAQDPASIATLIAFALLGVVLGVTLFAALVWNVQLLMGQGKLWPALALPLVRLCVAGGGFVFAAMHGAGALLACLTGFLAARALALRIVTVPQ